MLSKVPDIEIELLHFQLDVAHTVYIGQVLHLVPISRHLQKRQVVPKSRSGHLRTRRHDILGVFD